MIFKLLGTMGIFYVIKSLGRKIFFDKNSSKTKANYILYLVTQTLMHSQPSLGSSPFPYNPLACICREGQVHFARSVSLGLSNLASLLAMTS
jgi:hypothetical protein